MSKEILNDEVRPYDEHENKTRQLEAMFNKISKHYDFFNDLMSLGMARFWRKKAVSYLKPYQPKKILDIATGTADMCVLACELLTPEAVIGVDISAEMMEVGKLKLKKHHLDEKVHFEVQDCANLEFQNDSFDAVMIAFGIRNFEKLSQSVSEINRVLKPGGVFLILEANEPHKGFLFRFYKCYMHYYVMITTHLLSKDKKAYDYLTKSMSIFPKGKALISILEEENFELLKYKSFTFGVSSAYLLKKKI